MSFVILLVLTVVPLVAGDKAPLIGDRFPDLDNSVSWVHGAALKGFKNGQVYVLDFWATWCSPCYAQIDHLSHLEQRHRDAGLRVIGITLGTDMGTPLASFLAEERERISYTIVEPLDEEGLKRSLVHPLYNPIQDFALPFLLIVDRQGRLAWVSEPGNPEKGFEEALEKVLANTWDVGEAGRTSALRLAAESRNADRLSRARELQRDGRLREAGEVLLELFASDSILYAGEAAGLFEHMLCHGEEEAAYAYGRSLLAGGLVSQVNELIRVERAILLAPGLHRRDFSLASLAVRRAMEAKPDDPDLLYELAKIAHVQGDVEGAGELQRRAVDLAHLVGRDAGYVRTIADMPLERMVRIQATQFRNTRCSLEETPP